MEAAYLYSWDSEILVSLFIMGGWLDLTQQGLSPCKKYKTSWRSPAKSYRIINLVYVYDKIIIFTGSEIVSEIMNEKWSSLEEIANHLGVSKDTIYSWISNKKIPGHKIGRLWKFKVSEVDAWVRNGSKDK